MQSTQQQAYPGIIDTISAGFGVVSRRLALLLIPLLVDLALLVAPPVSVAPLLGQAVEGYQAFLRQVAANPASGITAEQAREIEDQVQGLRERASGLNLVHLLAWRLPSILRGMDSPLGERQNVQITTPGDFALMGVGLAMGGLLLAALYLGALAQYVRQGSFRLAGYALALGRQWRRLLGYTLVLLAGAAAVGVPALVVAGLLARFVPPLGALAMAVLGAVGLWAVIYLYFVDGAIFLGDAGVFGSIRLSVGLVRRHFWSALGLMLLSFVISLGTGIVWLRVVPNSFPWAFLSMIGNAYIATGLVAASFIYYRDRSAQTVPAAATSGGS